MKRETLKPCPFCGQEHTTITESNTEGIRIRCPKCNITFTRDFYEHRGELGRQRTIEAWNTRPEQPQPDDGPCEWKGRNGKGKRQGGMNRETV